MEKILLDEKYEQLLFQIPLLRDLPHNIKQSLLEKLEYSVYSIDKKDIVARQGTPCEEAIYTIGRQIACRYYRRPGQ